MSHSKGPKSIAQEYLIITNLDEEEIPQGVSH